MWTERFAWGARAFVKPPAGLGRTVDFDQRFFDWQFKINVDGDSLGYYDGWMLKKVMCKSWGDWAS